MFNRFSDGDGMTSEWPKSAKEELIELLEKNLPPEVLKQAKDFLHDAIIEEVRQYQYE